jgi:hypothetical protein
MLTITPIFTVFGQVVQDASLVGACMFERTLSYTNVNTGDLWQSKPRTLLLLSVFFSSVDNASQVFF